MNKNWPTKYSDLFTAQQIMEEYARQQNCESLGLFEVVVNQQEKRMDVRLSSWVVLLSNHFKSVYGENRGEVITRSVISSCITNGQTLH